MSYHELIGFIIQQQNTFLLVESQLWFIHFAETALKFLFGLTAPTMQYLTLLWFLCLLMGFLCCFCFIDLFMPAHFIWWCFCFDLFGERCADSLAYGFHKQILYGHVHIVLYHGLKNATPFKTVLFYGRKHCCRIKLIWLKNNIHLLTESILYL